jgi:ketosteroid isomerase-like protein
MTRAVLEAQVKESLDRSELAFAQSQSEFFDQFAEDAVIFTADSPEPIKGREAYRQRYQTALSAQHCEKTILDRKIQIVGDKAVVTQKARITQDETSANVSQTMVYGLTKEGLRVLHAQTAFLAPLVTPTAESATVQVINERIAAVPEVVGVAQ